MLPDLLQGAAPGPSSWEEAMGKTETQVEKLILAWPGNSLSLTQLVRFGSLDWSCYSATRLGISG